MNHEESSFPIWLYPKLKLVSDSNSIQSYLKI